MCEGKPSLSVIFSFVKVPVIIMAQSRGDGWSQTPQGYALFAVITAFGDFCQHVADSIEAVTDVR